MAELEETDHLTLNKLVGEFAGHFKLEADKILNHDFIKLYPRSLRPYGRLYAY